MASEDDLPSREAFFDEWGRRHGYDPSGNPLVRWWLSLTYVVARPVAGLPPDVVTLAGVVVAAVALWPAAGGGGWLAVAAALVVLAGLLDSLDGAVAVLGGRATRFGAVLDGVADRVSELLFLGALVLAGAPLPVAALAGALAFLHEYLRAAARAEGMTDVGVVTVAERPTRVIVTAAFLLAGVVVGDPWPALGAWAWVGLGVVGLGQLLPVVRRALG